MSWIDSVEFFDTLANRMNAHPERFEPLGPADMVVAVVMHRPKGDFAVRLDFEGVGCTGVRELEDREVLSADFRLDGPIDAWQAMFDDILANGRATGGLTINSLALMGDQIQCLGADPMGLDKFSRYNQTLQQFLDGASEKAAFAESGGR